MSFSARLPIRLTALLSLAIPVVGGAVAVDDRPVLAQTTASVTLTSPTAAQQASGTIPLTVTTTGPINAVKWYVDGVQVAWDSSGPVWSQNWNSASVSNGQHRIYAFARTTSGTWLEAKAVVTVSNSGAPPPSTGLTRAPVGALPGWRHIFVDDFDTNVPVGSFPQQVSSKWGAYPYPWRDSSGYGYYAPGRVVSVNNGTLKKDLRTVNGEPSVAALTPKVPGSSMFGTLYGRYEVRFRATKTPGYKVAWLLWPDKGTHITGSPSGVGGNGEIDFPETNLDSDQVMGFVHRQDAVLSSDQYWAKSAVDIPKWHTYTIEWSPNLVVFLLDGYQVGRTTERIPRTAMHWVLQTETQIGAGKPPADARGTVEIDWVSVWAYNASTFGSAPPPPLSPSAYPVRVTAPATGASVRGTVPLGAGVLGGTYRQVHWFIRRAGGPSYERIAMDYTGPTFSSSWDTRSLPNGQVSLWANGLNSAGQWISSGWISVTIAN